MIVNKRNLTTLLVVIFLLYFPGCSTTHNYKVLSFFFDGVPEPTHETTFHLNDTINGSDADILAQNLIPSLPQTQFHQPYQNKQCNSCHDQGKMGTLKKPMPDLCYQCHENFSENYKVLHGPVGGGQCTMCHSPHMSLNKDLIIRTSQSLCLYCHDSREVLEVSAHQDMKDITCTECHNPHGGADRNLLR